MENIVNLGVDDDKMDMPPGFRFHPTDEELITFYLTKKVIDCSFNPRAIGEVDLNKCEPWDLPGKAKMGEKEWYFFCVKDRKYPTGLRTNRATDAGYWKATGKDKEIYRAKALVGMKKTLVFYKGRAPKGEKSDWVMHEYRMEGKLCLQNLSKTAKNEWVLSRIFKKNGAGKKILDLGVVSLNPFDNEYHGSSSSILPPLMDSSPYITHHNNEQVAPEATTQVPCFSSPMEGQKFQGKMMNSFNSPLFSTPAANSFPFDVSRFPLPNSTQTHLNPHNFQYPSSNMLQDQSQYILGAFLENNGSTMKQSCKTERDMVSVSQETGLTTEINTDMSSVVSNYEMGHRRFEHPLGDPEPISLESLWNY